MLVSDAYAHAHIDLSVANRLASQKGWQLRSDQNFMKFPVTPMSMGPDTLDCPLRCLLLISKYMRNMRCFVGANALKVWSDCSFLWLLMQYGLQLAPQRMKAVSRQRLRS